MDITFSDKAILAIIRNYTREAGVRNLEREISSICRKVAKEVLRKGKDTKINITSNSIHKYLGVIKFRFGSTEELDQIGVTTGLAWTDVGGELLQTEVAIMPGKGKLVLTGKAGRGHAGVCPGGPELCEVQGEAAEASGQVLREHRHSHPRARRCNPQGRSFCGHRPGHVALFRL